MGKNHIDLLFISNSPEIASAVEKAGIDYLFIDLETNGKEERQKNLDTVKSHHTFEDIKNVRPYLKKTKLLVRINSFYEKTKEEIELAIKYGADSIMLPMFETPQQVTNFIRFVNGRAEVILLLETKKAEDNLDEILKIQGIDRIHIGLNDLHLQKKKQFMFELFVDGTVENIVNKVKKHNIKYGFGGVSRIGDGVLPATNILAYHYYLGSSSVILSRNFCNLEKVSEREAMSILISGTKELREFYKRLGTKENDFFIDNNLEIERIIKRIIGQMKHV